MRRPIVLLAILGIIIAVVAVCATAGGNSPAPEATVRSALTSIHLRDPDLTAGYFATTVRAKVAGELTAYYKSYDIVEVKNIKLKTLLATETSALVKASYTLVLVGASDIGTRNKVIDYDLTIVGDVWQITSRF